MQASRPSNDNWQQRARILGVVGALFGAALGYWCVGAFAHQGLHAIVLPAALPGVVAGFSSKERSRGWAVFYGVLGMAAALLTEWRFRPFVADSGLGYFLRHLHDLQPIVIAVIIIGAILGAILSISFWRSRRDPEGSNPS